jgi:hypothetical protein
VSVNTIGKLAEPADISDTWNIDLQTPCFAGLCAFDWDAFVHAQNPQADPNDYIVADPTLNGATFGCDLWIEVTGISGNAID